MPEFSPEQLRNKPYVDRFEMEAPISHMDKPKTKIIIRGREIPINELQSLIESLDKVEHMHWKVVVEWKNYY